MMPSPFLDLSRGNYGEEKKMNLMDLQNILGEQIRAINNKNLSADERKKELENADITARLAKQMINNADIVLRSEKLMSEGNDLPILRGMIHSEKI